MSVEIAPSVLHQQRILNAFESMAQHSETDSVEELTRMRLLLERYERTLRAIASSDPDYDALHVISLAQSALEARQSLSL